MAALPAGLPAVAVNREPLWGRRATHRFMMPLATIFLGVGVSACGSDAEPTTGFTPAAPVVHKVLYEAEGEDTTEASYTLRSDNGGTVQGDVDLPLKNKAGGTGLTMSGFKSGAFVYLSIQNGKGYGSVTCRITIDGKVVSENTSHGGYKIATCTGTVP